MAPTCYTSRCVVASTDSNRRQKSLKSCACSFSAWYGSIINLKLHLNKRCVPRQQPSTQPSRLVLSYYQKAAAVVGNVLKMKQYTVRRTVFFSNSTIQYSMLTPLSKLCTFLVCYKRKKKDESIQIYISRINRCFLQKEVNEN